MKLRAKLSLAAAAIGLAACASGGGGGGGVGVAPPPVNPSPPPPPAYTPVPGSSTFKTPEYNLMGGLDQVHAADAYALGYTGKGVIIGIVDFNFDFSSTEVHFDPASVGPNAQNQALDAAVFGPGSTDQHGQAVASTAAALKNGIGVHGIAFDATVLAVDYYADVDATEFTYQGRLIHQTDAFTYLTSHGARIINTSFGYEAGSGVSIPPAVSELYEPTSPAQAVVNGALLVASAGNAGHTDPSQSNFDIVSDMQTAGINSSSPGAFIIAGSVDHNNQISYFTDRAGSLASYYLVAPGEDLTLPWNGALTSISGTSFSSPLIAGAAAIVLQKWPNLTARQVADILFQSATDLGAPGVDTVYGNGLLNLNAALQPVGTTTMAVQGGDTPLMSETTLVLGTAFGDAPALHASLSRAMIFDGFGRDFVADLSPRVVSRPSEPDLLWAMQQKLGWHGTGLQIGSSTALDFDVRESPLDGIASFGARGGLDYNYTHDTVFRFSGSEAGIAWTAGTGLGLSQVLPDSEDGDAFALNMIAQGFAPMVGAAPSAFAAVHLPLDAEETLSLGVSESQDQGMPGNVLYTPYHNAGQSMAVHFDETIGASRFGFEIGDLMEEGGVLGSLASGGLKMSDRASTAWLSTSYERVLSARWALKGSLTMAATAPSSSSGSLITAMGPVYATSFAAGFAGHDLFGAGDALSFSLDQPLRAEIAPVTLSLGEGLDQNGHAILQRTQSSLNPSGREFDVETAYRFPLGDWTGAVNLAYSMDAGNVRGVNAAAGLFWITRKF